MDVGWASEGAAAPLQLVVVWTLDRDGWAARQLGVGDAEGRTADVSRT
jgi:hypothetical protein